MLLQHLVNKYFNFHLHCVENGLSLVFYKQQKMVIELKGKIKYYV